MRAIRHRVAGHRARAVDHDRDVLRGDRLLVDRGRCEREREPTVTFAARLHVERRLPIRLVDLPLEDQLAGRACALGAQPHAAGGLLDLEAMRRRLEVLDRAGDLDDDRRVCARHRRVVAHGLRAAVEPLRPPHLDALLFLHVDREHPERERALAVLLEQRGVAALPRHVVVDLARGLLLEHFTDDLLFAVPVREAFDVRVHAGAQAIATFGPAAGVVLVDLGQRGRRVLAVDRDVESLLDNRHRIGPAAGDHDGFDRLLDQLRLGAHAPESDHHCSQCR